MTTINMDQALANVEGDGALLKELTETLLAELPGQMKKLLDVIIRRDANLIERTAHRLKGSLGIVGAVDAYHLVSEIEQRGREARLVGIQSVYHSLEKHIAELESFFLQCDWEQNA